MMGIIDPLAPPDVISLEQDYQNFPLRRNSTPSPSPKKITMIPNPPSMQKYEDIKAESNMNQIS